MKSIVIAGSRGIGKSIADALRPISTEMIATSSREVDTSDLASVRRLIEVHPVADVLVLNTGGPPAMAFEQATDEIWLRSFNQLFLAFTMMLRDIRINDGGYVFLISSYNIKEPEPHLVLSSSLRLGFTSVLKTVSKLHMARQVTFLNIAPGPTDTDRLRGLLRDKGKTVEEHAITLPSKRVADPNDIGKFVRFVVESRIRSLNGQTIAFDMGLGNSVL